MLESVLVANRGEIAVRIVRACRDLGIRSIVAHSDVDADSAAVRLADEAVVIGPAPAARSYLDAEAVLAAAGDVGAQAVHPGYGFLAENADFARTVEEAGLVFVGPDAATMDMLGDKLAGREAAAGAGLPVLPGRAVAADAPVTAELVDGIGLPVLVKAAFGGGGRGMRRAGSLDELAATLETARRESGAAFGRAEVYLERLVERPRHVEVQILGDARGPVLHLGTRDCTVQRRHQKLIEEAPAPDLPGEVREAMLAGAVALASEVGYRGAGTVEFLFDPATGEFHFLEVNARLQVEHPVTELVTGVDLVSAQLLVAGGEPLGFGQDDIVVRGHAVEARILAEDPTAGFRPETGTVTRLDVPSGPWVRVDAGVSTGSEVTANYDSLLLKVCALGDDRATAISRLRRALAEMQAEGVATTGPYIDAVLGSAPFAELGWWTGLIDADGFEFEPPVAPATEAARAGADGRGPDADTEAHHPDTAVAERVVTISTGWRDLHIAVPAARPSAGGPAAGAARREGARRRGPGDAGAPPRGAVAPMDATLLAYSVSVGDEIEAGAPVAIVESMKLETHITSDRAGIVVALRFAEGDLVRRGDVLVDIEVRHDG